MKKLKNKINLLNLSYKHEMAKIIISVVLIVIIEIFIILYLKKLQFFPIIIITSILIFYLFNKDYDKRIEEYNQNLENEFVTTLNYIQTYLSNGFNVYQSINEVIPICGKNLNVLLTNLLLDIDEDKTVTPFITFSNHFKSSLIEQVMISLYLMIENGTDINYLSRFSPLFTQLKKDNEQKIVKNISSKYDSLNLLPVIGAGIITIIIIVGIVGIIGGMINGI